MPWPGGGSTPVVEAAAAVPDETDRRIINALQGDFPLVPEPYREVAARLGLDEAELLRRLDAMLECKVLTRFGPMFQIERAGGAFVLAAIEVRVLALVIDRQDRHRREHALNMWFVLATATPEGIAETTTAIEAVTGLPVFAFPKEREYFVEMKLHA